MIRHYKSHRVMVGFVALTALAGCSSSQESVAANNTEQAAAQNVTAAKPAFGNTVEHQPKPAKTRDDPRSEDGVPTSEAKSPDVAEAENVIKMIIGLNHQRCFEIVNVQKVQDALFDVTCIKRAGHAARVHYAVDAANNAVVGVN